MFLPLTAIILAGIILTAAMQGVRPSLFNMLVETQIAGVGLFLVYFRRFSGNCANYLAGRISGGGGGTPKPAKAKTPPPKKEKIRKKKGK